MQCDDRLPRPRGAGRAGRACVAAVHDALLRRVQEHGPLLPRRIQRLGQRVLVLCDAEATQGIRVREGIDRHAGHGLRRGCRQPPGTHIFEQCFGSFRWQVLGHRQEAVLAGSLNGRDPVGRHTHGHQALGGEGLKRQPLHYLGWIERKLRYHRSLGKLLDPLPHLDDLHGTRVRMRLNAAALCPSVGVVMVTDIGEQEAGLGLIPRLADRDPCGWQALVCATGWRAAAREQRL